MDLEGEMDEAADQDQGPDGQQAADFTYQNSVQEPTVDPNEQFDEDLKRTSL